MVPTRVRVCVRASRVAAMRVTLPIIHPDHSGWTRERMPQIGDTRAFARSLRAAGISARHAWRSAGRLRPIQNEIDLGKVAALISAGLDTKRFPVVISADGYILDGHHRAWAARLLGVRCYCLIGGRGHRALLRRAEAWAGSAHEGVTHADRITRTHAA